MRRGFVKVRIGKNVVKVPCVIGSDGLRVADTRGTEESERLYKRLREAALERLLPQMVSPFRMRRQKAVA